MNGNETFKLKTKQVIDIMQIKTLTDSVIGEYTGELLAKKEPLKGILNINKKVFPATFFQHKLI